MQNGWNPQYCGQCCKPIVKAFYSGCRFGPIINWSSMAAASTPLATLLARKSDRRDQNFLSAVDHICQSLANVCSVEKRSVHTFSLELSSQMARPQFTQANSLLSLQYLYESLLFMYARRFQLAVCVCRCCVFLHISILYLCVVCVRVCAYVHVCACVSAA